MAIMDPAFGLQLSPARFSRTVHSPYSPFFQSRCRKRPRHCSCNPNVFFFKITIRSSSGNPEPTHPDTSDDPEPSPTVPSQTPPAEPSQELLAPDLSLNPNVPNETLSTITDQRAESATPHEDHSRDAKTKTFAAGAIMWAWHVLRKAFTPGGFVWGLATGLAISVVLVFFPGNLSSSDALLREKVTLFDFILQDINSSYVDKVDINRLFETGVNSMLGTLDPYTQFENNTQAMEMSVKTNGKYAGVGLVISVGDPTGKARDKPIIVVSAFEGYAFDAGIRPGDIIETVDNTPVSGNSLERVSEMLRGEPGTAVGVSVRREGFRDPLTFSLSRRSVHIRDVPASTFVGQPEDAIGYIRLQSFSKDAATEVKEAVQRLTSDVASRQSQRGLQGLVLDLRGNPGGLLSAAIEVAEVFLPKDSVVVSTKGRGLGLGPVYISSQDPALPSNVPIAVLVDGQTASASEIVAGALQDLDYGVIVGSKTFGKGLVQNVQELPFNTALKYTVGKYYTPSGRCIQALNYEQAEGDGPPEVKKVEESQRKEFRTRMGRIVRDGGGIEPDVDVQGRPSFLEIALQRQNMYFRYASRYGADTKMQTLPDDFTVTDMIYRDFVKFVTSSEFKYESSFDQAFVQLNDMFKDVGYESAQEKVNDLKRVTESEMKSDFLRHEKDIRSQLESAIRYRFQPDSQRIIAELKNDDQLAQAVLVLKNSKEYNRLLAPQNDDKPTLVIDNGGTSSHS